MAVIHQQSVLVHAQAVFVFQADVPSSRPFPTHWKKNTVNSFWGKNTEKSKVENDSNCDGISTHLVSRTIQEGSVGCKPAAALLKAERPQITSCLGRFIPLPGLCGRQNIQPGGRKTGRSIGSTLPVS